jgi:MEMO1 family protein
MSNPLPRVKEPGLAGRWYPADSDVLARTIRDLLAMGGVPRPGVVAVVVPHAAYQYSGPTAARAFAAVGGGHRRAIVLGPSHRVAFRGAALLPMGGYRTPLGTVTVDEEAVTRLAQTGALRPNPAVFQREHSLEIQLPFLQTVDPGCALVPVLVGRLEAGDAEAVAAALRPLLDPGTLLVVSSDLVHYGRGFDYLPVPPSDPETVAGAIRKLDEGAIERILARDADGFASYVASTGATICGQAPIDILLRALPAAARGESLGYATSLDATGDYEERVVSYAALAFAVTAA